jgi:tRNA(fMet)-specific endonuclease VapC
VKYLLDTDICVFWLRGRPAVQRHLATVGPDEVAISVVTLAELRYGAASSALPDDNHRAIDDFVSGISVIGLTAEAARMFGEIKAHLRRSGMLLEDVDLLLAATARTFGLVLVSNNTSHFGRIPDLIIQNWLE